MENKKIEIVTWIENFEGIYQVSTAGKIYSWKSGEAKEIKAAVHTVSGHLMVSLKGPKNKRQVKIYVHRLVWESFKKEKLGPKDWVRHIDKNPQNNSLSNLRVQKVMGTPKPKLPTKKYENSKYQITEEDGTILYMKTLSDIAWYYGVHPLKIADAIKTNTQLEVVQKKNL